jgi:hypothetical protein
MRRRVPRHLWSPTSHMPQFARVTLAQSATSTAARPASPWQLSQPACAAGSSW